MKMLRDQIDNDFSSMIGWLPLAKLFTVPTPDLPGSFRTQGWIFATAEVDQTASLVRNPTPR
jgi:hypothetical protein